MGWLRVFQLSSTAPRLVRVWRPRFQRIAEVLGGAGLPDPVRPRSRGLVLRGLLIRASEWEQWLLQARALLCCAAHWSLACCAGCRLAEKDLSEDRCLAQLRWVHSTQAWCWRCALAQALASLQPGLLDEREPRPAVQLGLDFWRLTVQNQCVEVCGLLGLVEPMQGNVAKDVGR